MGAGFILYTFDKSAPVVLLRSKTESLIHFGFEAKQEKHMRNISSLASFCFGVNCFKTKPAHLSSK